MQKKEHTNSLVTWLLEAGIGLGKATVLLNPVKKETEKARMDRTGGWSSNLGGQASNSWFKILNHEYLKSVGSMYYTFQPINGYDWLSKITHAAVQRGDIGFLKDLDELILWDMKKSLES